MNDVIYKALGDLGYTGSLNDRMLSRFNSDLGLGASTSLNDAMFSWLVVNGATPSNINDMWAELLTAGGYTGSLGDQYKQFWEAGGTFTQNPPSQFTDGMWSLLNGDDGTSITVVISTLPSANGAAITDIEYRVDAGSWVSSGGKSSFDITGLTVDVEVSITIRAVNSEGPGAASNAKTITPTVPITEPDAFDVGDWSLADDTTGGTLNVTITSLPNDGGSVITDIEYSVGAGSWTSFGASTVGTYQITGLVDDTPASVRIRAVNAIGAGLGSDTKVATPTAPVISVPSNFTVGMWALNDATSGGTLNIVISTLPSDGGSALTDIEYRVDGGSWVSVGAATTGTYQITGLTDGVSYNVELRAENAVGFSAASDTKAQTPTTVVATVTAVDNQGTAYLSETSNGLSMGADSPSGLLSFFVYAPTTISIFTTILKFQNSGSSNRLYVYWDSDGSIRFLLLNASGTIILNARTAASTFAPDTWYHVAMSWDLVGGSPTLQFYVDGSQVAYSDTPSLTSDDVGWATAVNAGVFDRSIGGEITDAYLSTVYLNTQEFLDLSVPANLAKLVSGGSPVDPGSDGSSVTGTQPAVLLNGATSGWHTNKGYAGGFTENGTLVDAPSTP